jgi:hypothetical protein
MAYYYSASERAFFSSEFMTVGEMPADKVAVADGTWKTLVADQSAGKIIRTGASNAPESAAQSLAALTGYAVPAGMTVAGGVSATGSISAGGAITAGGTLTVKGGASLASASVSGTMDVTGTTNLKSTLTVAGKTTAKAMSATDISASTITTTGNASVGGTLTATGAATLNNTLNVAGKSTLKAVSATGIDATTVDTTGNSSVGGTLTVKGNATVGGKNVARSVDGVAATANGDVPLNAMAYKKLSSIQSVKGSFLFDSLSGIATSEIPAAALNGDWVGVQFGMSTGSDKTQIVMQGYEWFYRTADQNLGQENWSDWERFDPRYTAQNYLKLDGMNTMTGTIKSSVNGENSFVGAANGGTIINGTGKNGAFVPLWQYESTNEGSFVVSGYKNAFRIDFLSKENKAAGTNASEWMLSIDETGKMFVPNDLTIGSMLRLKGLGYRNVAYLEDAESTIGGQDDFVLAGGNQTTFICSGESGANPETTKEFRRSLKRSDEDIVLVADNNVVIATNAQNMSEAEVRKFTITNGGDVRFPSRFYPDIAGGHWNNSPYVLQSGNIERGANPSSNQYLYIPFYDKNGIENAKNRLAKIEFSRRTDGMTYIQMGVNSPANATGETFCGITARWRLIGGEYVAETMVSHHPGADSNDYSAATTKWVRDLVQAAVPTGTILPFDGTNVPSGYLVCNGAAVRRTTYAALFAVLGARHGEGDGKTTFNLPNAHRRFLEMTTTTSEVGETVEAGLPNITGQFRAQGSPDKRTKNSGAFANDGKGRIDGGLSNEGDYEDLRSFNASRCSALYGGSSTVQPPSLRALAIIKF